MMNSKNGFTNDPNIIDPNETQVSRTMETENVFFRDLLYFHPQLGIIEEIQISRVNLHDLSYVSLKLITEKVAIAAIKYSLLRVNRLQDMVFDYDTTVSLEGDSGPYIMYAYTRAKSILTQAKIDTYAPMKFNNEFELNLVRHLDKFSEVVTQAALNIAPNYICEYVYELAKSFNKFYSECPVLNAETQEEKAIRLLLTQATAQVLQNGLKLLGIKTVDKM